MRFVRAITAATLAPLATVGAQSVSFADDVLPILSDRCFQCHGPDSQARKADLRLDDRNSVFGERDGAAIIVPGDPEQSELIARITATDDDVMPPRQSHLRLSAAEIETLRNWVAQGAPWQTHWAYVAPQRPTPPKTNTQGWSRNQIDTFVLARLEQRGIAHNPDASPAALLRRVHLDLTGLPPTPAQLDAFLRDPSEAAYQRVVEQLLASPHYGERMAWPWLEASRYADTDGYQADPTRTAWPWRDWLVRALNDNLPFDEFTVQVLAGDLLDNPSQDQLLATGLLRNNAHNGEGGRIPEETRIENVFDRTETVATVWMGMTFECARCHDHKYDPVSQRDYYRLFAFFNQTSESGGGRSGGKLNPTMRYLGAHDQRRGLRTLEQKIARLSERLQRPDTDLDLRQAGWEEQAAARIARFAAATQPATASTWSRSQAFPPGPGGANAMFERKYDPETQEGIAAGPEWQPDEALADGTPHALPQGQYTIYFCRTIEAATARQMRVALGSDDAIKVWCNNQLAFAKNVRRGVAANQDVADLQLRAGSNRVLIKIVNTGGAGGFYFRTVEESVPDLPYPVARALRTPKDTRSDAHRSVLQRYFRIKNLEGYAAQDLRLRQLQSEQSRLLGSGVDVSVMDELPADKRRATQILVRGDYQQRGEKVDAGTPSFLPPLPAGARPDRLALARWLVSGDHPLTARVAVNRIWQTFFGRGLVATIEDFGRQGDRASHPLLLDWLATDFVQNGWDVKRLHRQIVTSSTYRQAAAANAAAYAEDPNNVFLARSARHRLPAWMLRDQALALSGRLVPKLSGAPVNPYQPEGIWAEATFNTIRYRRGSGDDLYRRSLYVFWRRIVGPTVFFDTQGRQACVVKRSITNTPLHSLTTMNETGFVESARGLAARAWHAADNPDARITWLFRAATARNPTPTESQLLRASLANGVKHFSERADAANDLIHVGESAPDESIPAVQLASLTALASIVLNLDEVLTRP